MAGTWWQEPWPLLKQFFLFWEKQIRLVERHIRKVEFHISKVGVLGTVGCYGEGIRGLTAAACHWGGSHRGVLGTLQVFVDTVGVMWR